MRAALTLAMIAGSAVATPVQGPAPEPLTVALRVEVTTPAGTTAAGAPDGVLQLAPSSGEGDPVELELDGSGSYSLAVAPKSVWRVRASAEGYWGAEEVAVAGGAPTVLALFPVGVLRGDLSLPSDLERPERLHLMFQWSPARPAPEKPTPSGRVVCPVDQQSWSCLLPAGVFDLRFHAPGFASVLVWDAPVEAGRVKRAADVSLVPGAAVLGRVELDGGARLGEVEVELRPAGAATREPEIGGRLGQLFRTTHPDERGYFQFEDLAPGVYRIEARHGGLAPAVREPVEVIEGREADLMTPLVLAPASELVLLIDPPVPPRALRAWNVQLYALDGSNERRSVDGDWSGVAELELAPGWYRLTVRDGRSDWLAEEIELSPGRTVRNLEIPVVAVEGTVRWGERRVRARLDFGGQQPRGEEVTMFTDGEGYFRGHLPGEGEWPLTLLFEPGGSEHRLEPVDVVKRPGEEVARLDIELPQNLLSGRVVDSQGRPVAGATVLAWREGSRAGRSKARSDQSGEFKLVGLDPGHWIVEAFDTPRSGRSDVDLEKGRYAQVEIRLGDERALAGRVVSDWGPVAGALIYVVPEVPRLTPLSPWKSDPLGAFEARVPADATGVHLFVMAVGRAARLLWVPLAPEIDETPEVEVAIAAPAGRLRLEVPPSSSGRVDLVRGAARVPLGVLRDWATAQGTRLPVAGRWTVDGMEPGPWALCRAAECDHGVLPSGGELELSLSVPEEDRATPSVAGRLEEGEPGGSPPK